MELPIQIPNNTTYEGMTIILTAVDNDDNEQPIDISSCDITATFELKGSNLQKKSTIGNGISDIDAPEGTFSILKNEFIDWNKGIWLLTVELKFPDLRIKKYIYKQEYLWII